MKRRSFLAAGAAAVAMPLARPAIAASTSKMIFVPQGNLVSMDPVWTTAAVTRCATLMVYETLYGRDQHLNAHPQMVAGHVVEDGGKRWTMTLRDGQKWHDGTPVLARDCVASVRRWLARDGVGATLTPRIDALEAKDDKTLVWRLNKPFASLPNALAKTQPTPVMMPERLAKTDPHKQITEVMGSGPFRWVKDEYVSGNRAVFVKNEKYVPREGTPDYAAGGYHVMMDRVEWKIIPDASTAANALVTGEVDWVEMPLPDLLPLLRKSKGVSVGRLDPFGIYPALRPNFLNPPTSEKAIRQVMLAAIDQKEVMTALMGDDADSYHVDVGAFIPGSICASNAGMERITRRHTPAELKAMLKAAGYKGEKLAFMHPTDQIYYDPMTQVAIAQLRAAGFNIDDQTTDWGTIVQRRTSKKPLDQGGWSCFVTGFPAVDQGDPILTLNLRGNGAEGWNGWPTDPKIEALRDAWIDSTDEAERKKLAEQIQVEALDFVTVIPLGQYMQSTAWRSDLKGLLKGPVPVFWNISRG
jgi:peptide/nickel transport system substrate-binding protein